MRAASFAFRECCRAVGLRSAAWLAAALLAIGLALAQEQASGAVAAPEGLSQPTRWHPTDPPNRPIGRARGIFPGRVVWIHEPAVARWTGDPANGGWYEDNFTDPVLAAQMLSRALRLLAGAPSDRAAWDALFRHFNRTHGRGDIGYRPGQLVAIKLNMNCSPGPAADPSHGLYNTPQVTLALLRQLVQQAGVRQEDIVVFDASRFVNDTIYRPAHAEFPGIRFEDREGGDGRAKAQPDKAVALHFADPSVPDSGRTYLPTCVTRATYLINVALLKGHSLAAVTLCAKNHYGSVYRENTGPQDPHRGWNPSHMHESITTYRRPMGSYNALVELMGHKDLGGKTLLYLIDALYAAPHQNHRPEKWQSPPFSGHWTASLFASQDPVALESVVVDFCAAEQTAVRMVGAVDNYLHEAALADRPPSGARYDPEGDGTPLESLGVHEHWNDPQRRQYSRNLGTGAGIELVTGR